MAARKKPQAAPSKTRTSIWLANDLRAQLDKRCEAENSSLARMIEMLLRDGLSKRVRKAADASIFG
ncbi:hypothetical protein [Rhodopseudomonas pseudopalustris]|uniref:Uncharacterized protein n=1 Tax=Rhodopseudomonas pseudopalustris TaxID=1513892 RepID=A0A1H8WHD7_9BRAD|nr:hypothetical protein [Rhodopseudomonas pseudopalustris]SEP27056.1 hypothetical protein SAMN05444123_11295 [Rhodopseudomonas pseudopalustris]